MTQLVTLSGNENFSKVNPALLKINPKDLDDSQAGLLFMRILSEAHPGITWGEYYKIIGNSTAPANLAGLKSFLGSIYDGGKGFIGDVTEGVGDILGSGVRLATDEQVINGVSRIGTAYATGGSSEGLMSIFSSLGAGGKQVLDSTGRAYKSLGLPGWSIYAVMGLAGFGLIYWAVKK